VARTIALSALLALAPVTGAARAAPAAGDDLLARAVEANDVAAVRAALAGKADPNARLAHGETPLARAVYVQMPEMVALLLANDADPDSADTLGMTPLTLACEMGGDVIIRQLLDAGADARKSLPDGTTPLALCARHASSETVERLLALRAQPNHADARGQTPLMWAASAGKIGAMRALLKAGANVNRVTAGGFTPLFFAIKSGAAEPVKLLLDAGADHHHRGPENTSAIQLAMYQKNHGAAALLVPLNADLEVRDRHGLQLLHVAAAAGDADLVAQLIKLGANPEGLTGPSRVTWVTEANFGMPPPAIPPKPPLFLAAEHGHDDAMRLIVKAGGDVAFVASDGTNIIHAAAKGGSAAALKYALELAHDANVADKAGTRPLHILLSTGMHPELEAMMRVLARHGARGDLENEKGFSPADFAKGSLSQVKAIYDKVFAAVDAARKSAKNSIA